MEPTVLHVANFKARYSSNFLASMCALSRYSRRMGLRQVMGLPRGAQGRRWIAMLRDHGIAVHLLPEPSAVALSTLAIAHLARSENAVIIHTHFSRQYEIEAAAARLLCRRPQIRLLWHRHSAGPATARPFSTRLKDLVGNRLLAPDSVVIAVSAQLRDAAIESGISPSHATTVENGIDLARVQRVSTTRSEIRKSWSIGEEVFTFLHFGWDPVTKGVDLVLRACRRIREGRPFALVMVGLEITADAARKVTGPQLPPWLRIIPPVETVGDLYAASDCLVSSSRWEGSPYTVGEAMVAGLPIISTDIPGVKAVSASEGVILTPFDEGKLAERMTQVLTSAAERRRGWSDANRNFILQNYSVEHWAERVVRIYAALIDRSMFAGNHRQ